MPEGIGDPSGMTRNPDIRFVCVEEIGRTSFVELTAQEIVNHL